ncbi:MAG: flagellar protein FliS [Gammaproteobacteria bacterium]
MSTSDKLSLYKQVELDARVHGASPHKLILMLFDGALAALEGAKLAIENADIQRKSEYINHVSSILAGLRDSLNVDVESDLPNQLDRLYEYMQRQVFEVHVRNDCQQLEEIQRLLLTVKSGWSGISADVS